MRNFSIIKNQISALFEQTETLPEAIYYLTEHKGEFHLGRIERGCLGPDCLFMFTGIQIVNGFTEKIFRKIIRQIQIELIKKKMDYS